MKAVESIDISGMSSSINAANKTLAIDGKALITNGKKKSYEKDLS